MTDDLLHLQMSDIDSCRMVVHMRQGKGRNGRTDDLPPINRRACQFSPGLLLEKVKLPDFCRA